MKACFHWPEKLPLSSEAPEALEALLHGHFSNRSTKQEYLAYRTSKNKTNRRN